MGVVIQLHWHYFALSAHNLAEVHQIMREFEAGLGHMRSEQEPNTWTVLNLYKDSETINDPDVKWTGKTSVWMTIEQYTNLP